MLFHNFPVFYYRSLLFRPQPPLMRRLSTENKSDPSEWMNNREKREGTLGLTPYCHYTCGFHQDTFLPTILFHSHFRKTSQI